MAAESLMNFPGRRHATHTGAGGTVCILCTSLGGALGNGLGVASGLRPMYLLPLVIFPFAAVNLSCEYTYKEQRGPCENIFGELRWMTLLLMIFQVICEESHTFFCSFHIGRKALLSRELACLSLLGNDSSLPMCVFHCIFF